jgi:ATP-dependent RNA helicase DDX49/DBP8
VICNFDRRLHDRLAEQTDRQTSTVQTDRDRPRNKSCEKVSSAHAEKKNGGAPPGTDPRAPHRVAHDKMNTSTRVAGKGKGPTQARKRVKLETGQAAGTAEAKEEEDYGEGITLFSHPSTRRHDAKDAGRSGAGVRDGGADVLPNRITLDEDGGDTFGGGEGSFRALGLTQWLSNNVVAMGITRPTPVQRGCIPAILQGRDVIGTAQTGTGKTAAFALPILQLLGADPYGIFCLCLTPTRELATQIADQFVAFSTGMTLRCQVILGGEDIRSQAAALVSRPHIVVATPGRLMEHFMYDDALAKAFSKLQCLVLDEADRLLDPGFEAELRIIMHNLPTERRQTLLFSATITRSIAALQEVTMKKAIHFEAFEGLKVVERCKQEYCFVPAKVKEVYLVHLLSKAEAWGVRSVIVFAGTIHTCQLLQETLTLLGVETVALHAVKKQRHRVASLARFKSGEVRILIATDVASRGLDIPTVDLVINHDVPVVPRDYVHRVGRTARAGRGGRAITLVSQYDISLIHQIEELTGVDIVEVPGLEEADVLKDITRVFAARRGAKMKMGENGGFDDQLRQRKSRMTS